MKNTVFVRVFCAVLRGILDWYSEGLRILCECSENPNATRYSVVFSHFCRIWCSRSEFARILVCSCAFLMYSVEYGRSREMHRIRVRIRQYTCILITKVPFRSQKRPHPSAWEGAGRSDTPPNPIALRLQAVCVVVCMARGAQR